MMWCRLMFSGVVFALVAPLVSLTEVGKAAERSAGNGRAWEVLAPAQRATPLTADGRRGLAVKVRFDRLSRAAATGGTIELPLTLRLTVRVAITQTQVGETQTFIAGRLVNGHSGEASLTAVGDTLAGRIVADNRVFIVRRAPNSTTHVVAEVDQRSFPPEAPPRVPPRSGAEPNKPQQH